MTESPVAKEDVVQHVVPGILGCVRVASCNAHAIGAVREGVVGKHHGLVDPAATCHEHFEAVVVGDVAIEVDASASRKTMSRIVSPSGMETALGWKEKRM